VLAAVAGDGLRAVATGLAVGLAAALALRRWIGPLLFQASPSDPAVMSGVAALLFGISVVAILVPTLRALRYSPATVLRVN
jgi:ABC-type antimicrobial peptide transport system permease subunit